MKFRCCLFFALLGALGGHHALLASSISSIDVSTEEAITVHTGDTLVFHLFTWNFGRNAAMFDLPAFPADLTFAMVTAPVGWTGEFAATLESEDRSVNAAIGDLKFNPGFFTSSGYSGEVSSLQGYLHLSPQLSRSIFQAGSIVIALQNLGPDLELGLSPYFLRQNMFVSLSVGRLSVGALPGWVELEEPQNPLRLSDFGGPETFQGATDVPEPGPKGLLLAGGTILCGISILLRQFTQRDR